MAWIVFGLRISTLLLGINMPNDVVGQTVDAIACALSHLRETLSLGLVLKGVAREVDAYKQLR